jgi:cytoskeletal protein CcmA (bactofilin family)
MALFSKERVRSAAAAGEARTYLDRRSKITSKLFFDGPVCIDGEVDGEITANASERVP